MHRGQSPGIPRSCAVFRCTFWDIREAWDNNPDAMRLELPHCGQIGLEGPRSQWENMERRSDQVERPEGCGSWAGCVNEGDLVED